MEDKKENENWHQFMVRSLTGKYFKDELHDILKTFIEDLNISEDNTIHQKEHCVRCSRFVMGNGYLIDVEFSYKKANKIESK